MESSFSFEFAMTSEAKSVGVLPLVFVMNSIRIRAFAITQIPTDMRMH